MARWQWTDMLYCHLKKIGGTINRIDKNKANWVSASDVGRAAFCGHFLELKYAGHKVSKYSEQLMKQSDIAHDDLNKLAEDKRCFIASQLYGINHVKT